MRKTWSNVLLIRSIFLRFVSRKNQSNPGANVFKFFLLLISFGFSCSAGAQNPFDIKKMLPTSPEAGMLGRFGEIPIGYYTGTPDISIPLYEVKEGEFSMPVIMRYHSSGVKVEDQAGFTGLGWNLDVAGSIVQIVNGVEDEVDRLASDDPAGYQFLKANIVNSIYNERTETGLLWPCMSLPNSGTDRPTVLGLLNVGHGQPDIYQFNFGGYSGRFYINPETQVPVQINKKQEVFFQKASNGWTATTLNGDKFNFFIRETAYIETSSFPTSYTYKLTRIDLASGKRIYFDYGTGYYKWLTYNETFHTPYNYGFDNQFYKKQAFFTEHHTLYLQKIRTDEMTMEFNLEDRADMLGIADQDGIPNNGSLSVKRLKSIDIIQAGSNKKIKSYNFSYDYFSYSTVGGSYQFIGNPFTSDILGKRLKLLSIKEIGFTGAGLSVENKPYQFQYDESVVLPLKTSHARDFWGYYNGKNNDKLIPDLRYFYFSGYAEYANMPAYLIDYLNGADRTPDLSKMGAAILQKVTYPTGGFTEFTYQPHSFTNYEYPDVSMINASLTQVVVEDKNAGTGGVSSTFSVPRNMTIRFTLSFNRGPNQSRTFDDLLPSSITLVRISGTGTGPVKTWSMANTMDTRADFNADGMVEIIEDINFTYQANVQYSIVVNLPDALGPQNTSNNSASAKASFSYYNIPTGNYNVSYGGGLAVNSITNFTQAGKIADKKLIKYIQEDNSSSGKLMSPLNYLYNVDMYLVKFFGWSGAGPGTANSIPMYGAGVLKTWFISSESHIPFSDGAAGSIVGYSRVEETLVDAAGVANGKRVFEYNNLESEWKINNPDNPRLLNGSVSKEMVYNGAGSLLAETNYEYDPLSQISFAGVKIFSTFFGDSPCSFMGPTDIWPAAPHGNNKQYRIHFYPINSRWFVLKQKQTRQYAQGNSSLLTETFTYNSKGQLSQAQVTNSKQETKVVQNVYPADVSSAPGSIEQKLKDNHLWNYLLEQRTLLDNVEKTKVRFSYKDEGQIVKDKIETSTRGGNLETETVFNEYGPYRSLFRVTHKGLKTGLLWNDAYTSIIAEVSNADDYDIAYTGFEPGETGNWIISGSQRVTTDALTGKMCYQLSNGSLGGTLFYPSKTYILTYWTTNTSPFNIPVTQGSPLKIASIGNWNCFRHAVTGVSSFQITGSGLIDEVRLVQEGILMKTYTHDPLIGISSITDASNRITFYEYDAFGRLMLVRDQDRNVIKKFEYQFQVQ